MSHIDWIILGFYIAGVVLMGILIGRRQKDHEDYFLGSRRMKPWQVGLSIVANQVSAISLIGAPAFVAMRDGGGLTWLQYEFAVPLAMIAIMIILVPVFFRQQGITIYEYLERRFGTLTRSLLSLVFLVSRGLGAGVVLLATSIVTSVCLEISLTPTVLLIGGIALIYTSIGGIKADIYSDIVQLAILWTGAIVSLVIIVQLLGSDALVFISTDRERLRVFNFAATGIGDNQSFSFWPMLIGGFFLYMSYYGCDQSQAQRLLTTATRDDARKALFWNGLLRFPLVVTYCGLGLFLIPFLRDHPDFASKVQSTQADFLVPYFLVDYVPTGMLGLIVAGIFAASMSSIDSVLNSLSAVTWSDIVEKFVPRVTGLRDRSKIFWARLITVGWGIVATGFALLLAGGTDTVIELINKIGSAFYGPVFAVFILGIFVRRATQSGAVIGLIAGTCTNIYLWLFCGSQVSWLWWNLIGFCVTFLIGSAMALVSRSRLSVSDHTSESMAAIPKQAEGRHRYLVLGIAFLLMVILCLALERFLFAIIG
ncbi:MAG: sodium transporter [Candidatus Zixiibacteriota bacterium]|nr:MAG: sodium transporter [candidate division Zixibacteria bacterium]